MTSSLKLKRTSKNKTKNDVIELDNSGGEEEVHIKWQNYEIKKIFITIYVEIIEEFVKSTRKQGTQYFF